MEFVLNREFGPEDQPEAKTGRLARVDPIGRPGPQCRDRVRDSEVEMVFSNRSQRKSENDVICKASRTVPRHKASPGIQISIHKRNEPQYGTFVLQVAIGILERNGWEHSSCGTAARS